MLILPPPSPDNVKFGSTEPVKQCRRFSVHIKNKQPKLVRNLRRNSSATPIVPDNKPQKPQPQSKPIPPAPAPISNKNKPQPQPTPIPPAPAPISNNKKPLKPHPQLTPIPPAPIANNNKPPKPQPEPLLNPTPRQDQHTPVTQPIPQSDQHTTDPQPKPVPKAKPQPSKNTTPTPPPPKTPTPSTSNGTTFRPVKNCKHTRDQILEAEHPYIARLERKESLLHKVMNDIFYLADNDLLTDKDSGENDYSMTLKFAHKLDYIAEILTGLSSNCTECAKRICNTVDDARDQKVQMQEVIPDVQLVNNITKMERSDELKEILK